MSLVKDAIRCTGCNKVIGTLDYLNDGKFSIKCGKCGVLNTITATPKEKAQSMASGIVLGTFEMQHIKEQE